MRRAILFIVGIVVAVSGALYLTRSTPPKAVVPLGSRADASPGPIDALTQLAATDMAVDDLICPNPDTLH